jgi:DNA-binding transcriptional ArsR family regulator
MTVSKKPRALDWFALATAGLHPTKIRALEVLAERGNAEASPADLAKVVGVSLGVMSYHVRELREKGLVELVRTEPRRGALQHFYRATEEVLLSPRQAARRALSRSANRAAGSDAPLTPDLLAQAFHETYERLAPAHGYKTREASAVPWEDVPDANKKLMRAVAGELLRGVAGA